MAMPGLSQGLQLSALDTMLLCTGGYIVISHPLGRRWLNEQLHEKKPEMVPHPLPDRSQLQALIADLPLHLVDFVEKKQLYIATLQVSSINTGGSTLHVSVPVLTAIEHLPLLLFDACMWVVRTC